MVVLFNKVNEYVFGLDLRRAHVRTLGALLIMLIIWVLEKPWLLNKAMIESGFSGVLNWVNLEILRAVSTEKPQVLTR